MSKNIIIAILGTVVVAGGGFFYYQNYMAADTASGTRERGSAREESRDERGMFESAGDAITGTFSDIVGRGDAVQCKFSGTDPETNEPVDGIVYVVDEDMYLEADTVMDGTELTIKVLQNGPVMYMWSDTPDVMPALKIDTSMFEGSEETVPESPLDWLKDPETGMDYSCRTWMVRRDLFEPPADVEFMDMFGMMFGAFGNMMGEMGGMGEMNGDMGNSDSYSDPFSGEDSWGSDSY